MSNPTVSFRISDYHLARALRAIRIIEPAWKLTTPANLIRAIFNDYVAKSEHHNNTSLNVSSDLLEEIILSRAGLCNNQTQSNQLAPMPQLGTTNQPQKSTKQIQRGTEEERIFAEIKRESSEKQNKASNFDDPNITESVISSVTDFSPPTDLEE